MLYYHYYFFICQCVLCELFQNDAKLIWRYFQRFLSVLFFLRQKSCFCAFIFMRIMFINRLVAKRDGGGIRCAGVAHANKRWAFKQGKFIPDFNLWKMVFWQFGKWCSKEIKWASFRKARLGDEISFRRFWCDRIKDNQGQVRVRTLK